jgi:hypothetical protein
MGPVQHSMLRVAQVRNGVALAVADMKGMNGHVRNASLRDIWLEKKS